MQWHFSNPDDIPPTPSDPQEYWKAVTIDGQHHVFPGETSHLDYVRNLGRTAHDVQHFWGWNPYQGAWESFDRFIQDYRNIDMDLKPGQESFNLPTFSKTMKTSSMNIHEAFPGAANLPPEITEEPEGQFPFIYGDKDIALGKPGAYHDAIWNQIGGTSSALGRKLHTHGYIGHDGINSYSDKPISPHVQQALQEHFGRPFDVADPFSWAKFGTDDYGLDAWGEDYDKGFKERSENPQGESDILDLLSPQPVPEVAQKGIERPDGTQRFWIPDAYGFPHHQQVVQALGLTKEIIKDLNVDEEGNISDANDWQNFNFS